MAGRIDLEVAKALRLAQGNRQLAQRELLKNVIADDDLLRELVAPFLKPLTAQAIDRALRAVNTPEGSKAKLTSAKAKSVLGGGYNPMKASANAAQTAPAKRPDASPRHVSTLKLLAAAYQIKRGEQV